MGYSRDVSAYAGAHRNMVVRNDTISDELYSEKDVKRGLRDINGKGVVVGLTNISEIISFTEKDGKRVPCDGQLWYRGHNIRNLMKEYSKERFGYETLAYLLLFGELPDALDKEEFIPPEICLQISQGTSS